MDDIFKILLQILLLQQYLPVPHNIMVYHNGKVYYAVVRNTQVLVYLVRRQTKIQQTLVQQYIYMFTAMYHVLLFMAYAHTKNKQYSLCVTLVIFL